MDDPKSPINAAFKGKGAEIVDEVNQLQEPNPRERIHVLLSVDMDKTPLPKHPMLPPAPRTRISRCSWIREEGKGRVFYFGLAHSPPIFWNAPMLEHFLAGIQYALGDLKADAAPSAKLGKK